MSKTYPKQLEQAPFLNNVLVNPGMEIWQRGVGPVTVSNRRTADEWTLVLGAGDSASITRSSTPSVGNYAIEVTTFTYNGIGSTIEQDIETFLAPEDGDFSFCASVLCSSGNAVRLSITDNDGSTDETVYSSYHSGSGNWERLAVAKRLRSGLSSLTVAFSLEGSFTGVLLDSAVAAPGYFPSGIDYAPLHPADDWERCLRHYYKNMGSHNSLMYYGQASTVSTIPHLRANGSFPCMRRGTSWSFTTTSNSRMVLDSVLAGTFGCEILINVTSDGNLGYIRGDVETGSP